MPSLAYFNLVLLTTVAVRVHTAPVVESHPTAYDAVMEWYDSQETAKIDQLTLIFEEDWLNDLSVWERAAYLQVADDLFGFLDTGADSNVLDSYIGFAPLLLRTSFHSSGTFDRKTGTGGSNGGTIYNKGELQDPQNGCIETATEKLEEIIANALISRADAVVIAGAVALERMSFPRMDLVKVAGGRKDFFGVAYRDRLPSADDDPLERFRKQLGFTLFELVALIGGSHNFGAAHGKCSGYEGVWTSSPLLWGGANGSGPEFFVDLLKDDWKWYEVCTYNDNTAHYKSIPDPFAAGAEAEEEEEEGHGVDLEEACAQSKSEAPIICEEQAMRGCQFDDGSYPLGSVPCSGAILRLKSDFFLKANPMLLPFAQQFAADADSFAAGFGNAYHKLTHNGLDRCGMSGHGCPRGTVCTAKTSSDDDDVFLFEECARRRGARRSKGGISDDDSSADDDGDD